MAEGKQVLVTVEYRVEVLDEMAVREEGFKAQRRGESPWAAGSESDEDKLGRAVANLLPIPSAEEANPELPGARVIARSVSYTDV